MIHATDNLPTVPRTWIAEAKLIRSEKARKITNFILKKGTEYFRSDSQELWLQRCRKIDGCLFFRPRGSIWLVPIGIASSTQVLYSKVVFISAFTILVCRQSRRRRGRFRLQLEAREWCGTAGNYCVPLKHQMPMNHYRRCTFRCDAECAAARFAFPKPHQASILFSASNARESITYLAFFTLNFSFIAW